METTTIISLGVLDEIIEYFDGVRFELAALIEEAIFTDYEVKPIEEESIAVDFDEALEMYYSSLCSANEQRAILRAIIGFTAERHLIPIMIPLLNSEYKDESILAIRKMAEILSEN